MRVLNSKEHNTLLVISKNTTVLKNTLYSYFSHELCASEEQSHLQHSWKYLHSLRLHFPNS